jgi:ubiquinone/menaquinone biosynthesis C-methylase UbiE
MLTKIRNFQYKLTQADHKDLLRVIMKQLDSKINASLLDIGCNDGTKTIAFAKQIHTRNVYGVDIIDSHIKSACEKGIKAIKSNIEQGLPFKDNTFDVVISNQVIEHLINTDFF